ncbi:MAG: SAM-dependent methyltransferase, partial [Steroidobacteraceae bacterium]
LAAAAAAAIPLTQRELAQSVTFATGHFADGDGLDWQAFARPRHTVVFYMGVAQMEHIVSRLLSAGAPRERPAAIVERATLPGERVLRGSLGDIASLARAERVTAPALLIIGEAAAAERGNVVIQTLTEALRGVA